MSGTMATSNYGDDTRWLPVAEAARLLGVTPQRIYQLIHEGQLHSLKIGATYSVLRRSIEARQVMLREEQEGPHGRW